MNCCQELCHLTLCLTKTTLCLSNHVGMVHITIGLELVSIGYDVEMVYHHLILIKIPKYITQLYIEFAYQ